MLGLTCRIRRFGAAWLGRLGVVSRARREHSVAILAVLLACVVPQTAVAAVGSPPAAGLEGVSCGSATHCLAVGFTSTNATNPEVPLAESWNGTNWVLRDPPVPNGSGDASLQAVSCWAPAACTTVGNTQSNGTLAEAWNGSAWSIQSTPNPNDQRFSYPQSVSCKNAKACTSVGFYQPSSGNGNVFGFAMRWDGSGWSLQNIAAPPGNDTQLLGVSCPTTGSCTAVGFDFDTPNPQSTLAELWNGTSWSIQSTPNPSGDSFPELNGVSCTAVNACMAVGNGSEAFAESWNGSSWSIVSIPNGANVYVPAVSCSASTACTAVGAVIGRNGRLGPPVAERWDGSSWTTQSVPSPAGATSSRLVSVSCPAPASCTAVGSYVDGTGATVPLAEAWNGTSWSIQRARNP